VISLTVTVGNSGQELSDSELLEGLQFGGKRNYGYGEVELKDTQMVDLDELDYSRLEGAGTYLVELVTPFVLKSEYLDANDRTVPWWWAENRDDLRLREGKVLEQCKVFHLETVDHGQVVKYPGDRPVETAKNGPNGSDPTPDTASENCG
jgi:CRISPR/Cas system CSM-associated protein Csm4 (group 5 of RAMP superfamily)